jgi:hypothetical protein
MLVVRSSSATMEAYRILSKRSSIDTPGIASQNFLERTQRQSRCTQAKAQAGYARKDTRANRLTTSLNFRH